MPKQRARRANRSAEEQRGEEKSASAAVLAQHPPAHQHAQVDEEDEAERHNGNKRVPKFRPFFLPTPDSHAMTWETWLRLFGFFIDGEGINDVRYEKQRIAALYCELGAEGARIGAELCPDDIGFDETIQRLQSRFGNRQSRLYNRAKFFQRGQLDAEDILGYVTELRQLASRCGFGASVEELIRYRLLAGCRVDRIREKLLLEPDTLTLADALKIAQSVERALQESGQLGPTRSNSAAPK